MTAAVSMTEEVSATTCVLAFSCPDATGIVLAVSRFLVEQECTILESQQYSDPGSRQFFMRVAFCRADAQPIDTGSMRRGFASIASPLRMTWRLADAAERHRVIILVSKAGHCLNDLLFRNTLGDVRLDVVAVVSNHPDLGRMADNYGVPFRHIPVTPDTKAEAEAELLSMYRTEDVDMVVLARYMQILSDDLVKALDGHAINIHHSMLPAFKGARPYHQAHARGVKTIGATAHYVTAELDEGPIIEQQLVRVDHGMSAEEFAKLGRGTEVRALGHAVRWHTENRVMRNGNKTVVFR